MTPVVFDTNIWIAYQPQTFPRSVHMSVVVLQELLAGAVDPTDVKSRRPQRSSMNGKENCLSLPPTIGLRRGRSSIRFCAA